LEHRIIGEPAAGGKAQPRFTKGQFDVPIVG
jgi:hypothetical protein